MTWQDLWVPVGRPPPSIGVERKNGKLSSMDKKSGYLILAVWLAPILISLKMDVWWVTCATGVISLLMGIFLLIYPRTRNTRGLAIVMVIVGVLHQGLAIMEFGFRTLSK
jgi:hypothetical protein